MGTMLQFPFLKGNFTFKAKTIAIYSGKYKKSEKEQKV